MKNLKIFFGFGALFLLACSGGAKISQGNDASAGTQRANNLTSASVEISAETGGYVNVGSAKLKIPAQAIAADTKITAEITDIQLPEGGPKAVGKGIKLSPEGLQFLTPAELEICYPGTDLASLNEKRVLVYYQMDNGEFAAIAGNVDQNTHCVKSHIEHFSSYVAAAVGFSGPTSPPNINTVNLLPATPVAGIPVRIRTIIDDVNGTPPIPGVVVAATIHYSINGGTVQVAPLQIDPTDDTVINRYYFEVPGNQVTVGGNIKYFIEAIDNVNQRSTRPVQPTNPLAAPIYTTINITSAAMGVRLTPASPAAVAAGNLQISAGFSQMFTAQATVNGTTWFNIPASGYALSNVSLGTLVQTGPSTIRFNATGAQAGQATLNLGALSSAFPINVVPGLLTHIEITDMNQVILTGTANLPTGQPYNFDVIGFDAFGNIATILPGFNTTGGIGSVTANALTGAVFQAGSTVTNGTIVVTLAGLTDSLAVTLYAPPQVTATAPASGTAGIALNSTIGVSFSHVMNAATLTTNTTTACTGSIQVSRAVDNFSVCVPMTSATPVLFASNTLAIITPAANLAGSTAYLIRVTAAALDTSNYPLAPIFVTATGFTTVPAPTAVAWYTNDMISPSTFNYNMCENMVTGDLFSLGGEGTTSGLTHWFIRKSDATGAIWAPITYNNGSGPGIVVTQPNNDGRPKLVCDNTGNMYIVGAIKTAPSSPGFPNVLKSSDGGVTFSTVDGPLASDSYPLDAAVSPTNEVYVISAKNNGTVTDLLIRKSDSTGTVWTDFDQYSYDAVNGFSLSIASGTFDTAGNFYVQGSFKNNNFSHMVVRKFDGSAWSLIEEFKAEDFPVAGLNSYQFQNFLRPIHVFGSKLYVGIDLRVPLVEDGYWVIRSCDLSTCAIGNWQNSDSFNTPIGSPDWGMSDFHEDQFGNLWANGLSFTPSPASALYFIARKKTPGPGGWTDALAEFGTGHFTTYLRTSTNRFFSTGFTASAGPIRGIILEYR